LKWGPVFEPLEAHLRSGDGLLLLISPFIGLEALQRFLESAGSQRGIKVIVRWRPEDLRNGVSDIAIFPYLTERGIPLYINQDIHLKLYAFESNVAFSTSGNLTLRGFGYSDRPNIEVGGFVQLTQEDWFRIYELIAKSKQVDKDLYLAYKQYLERCPKAATPATLPPEIQIARKAYTVSSLPATETPTQLATYYFVPNENDVSPDRLRRAAHDIVAFGLPPALSPAEFNARLGDAFRRTPFVLEFAGFLKAEKSLRFGAVNEWIHQHCEDVPLPYRWEIKDNTRIFYNWLEHFFSEITWDRPNFSQVIYWQEK
jgi:hypothetical protein